MHHRVGGQRAQLGCRRFEGRIAVVGGLLFLVATLPVGSAARVLDSAHPAAFLVTVQGPSQIRLGESALLHATATGGAPPYVFHWNENGSVVSAGGNSTLNFTPTADTIYAVLVSVNDSVNNSSAAATFDLDVTGPSPVSVTLSTVQPSSTSVIVTAHPIGGTPPYEYAWTGHGLSGAWSSNASVELQKLAPGSYPVQVVARDARGFTGSGQLTIISQQLTSSSGLPTWVWGVAGAGIGVLGGVLLLRHRARQRGAPPMRDTLPGP